MSTAEQPCYTLINFPTDTDPYNEMQLKIDLEKGDKKKKTEALKKAISIILSGEKIPGLLMIIIRFVLPLQDHTIKKLLLIFWEIVPKTTPDGKLMQEMILVCDAYRKDLQHPNEFIRGSTLRFLCKLKEPELLEPLMPAIRACLEHRHSYVRRNAVLAVFTIYRNFEFLIPDAPELIGNLLETEQDMSCKRNAFLMLLHADQERALNYLSSRLEQVHSFGDILQLVIVELIYKVCHAAPSERGRFVRPVYGLLTAGSAAVRYEAAGTLTALSTAPAALKAATSCYIDLIVKESDNNVKLIVLNRLSALLREVGETSVRSLQDLPMDLLRVLACTDLDVRKQTLDLALETASPRDAAALVTSLRREAARALDAEHDDARAHRQLLVRALHAAATKFPSAGHSAAPALLELVGAGTEPAAGDVMLFLREALLAEPAPERVYQKLLEIVGQISCGKVARSAVWLVAEFADTEEDAIAALDTLAAALPNLEESEQQDKDKEDTSSAPRQLVTSDGTYATQSAFNQPSVQVAAPGLAAAAASDSFTRAAIVSALGKLVLRLSRPHATRALHMAAVLLARDERASTPLTADDRAQTATVLRAATLQPPAARTAAGRSRSALHALLAERRAALERETARATPTPRDTPVESGVTFAQLAGGDVTPTADVFQVALTRALDGRTSGTEDRSKLSKVTQLTGLSDPVYAEAIVSVNQYDIVLDVLVVNQTDDTLQNCTVELATLGDLRLVERPAGVVLAPRAHAAIRAAVKVASTENGVIFGNIVYEVSGAHMDRGVVVLNDVHIDIVDYIQPAVCTDADFRHMWAEFEWENKVSVNTNITDLAEYLQHLLSSTNMKCLTPDKALSGQCGFMAANMYARSIFGEDALANLSVERLRDGVVSGHVRIRAKSQGMALSLGDKINMMQKATQQKTSPTAPAIPAA